MQGILGLAVLIGFAWLISEHRRKVGFRLLAAGLGLQFGLALIMLKVPVFQTVLLGLNDAVEALERATQAGTTFLFGYLGGGPLPFETSNVGAAYVFAFRGLPLLLVVSALSALLFYWRVIPLVVRGFSLMLEKTMNIGGALGVAVAANIFVGMLEAPLFIRPYMSRLTRSELFCLMTSGMATIAGTVLVLYASFLKDVIPGAMGQILTASIISAPASVLIAKIMVPETQETTPGSITPPAEAESSMDAVCKGTVQGGALLLNVFAMLIVLVALVALANEVLALLPQVNGQDLTLQAILGWIMAPVVWLIGIPWSEAATAGSLMGTKTVLNELLAYLQMAHLPPGSLSLRSEIIMTYAMCGFANLGSLGIMVGGLGAMVPERRGEVVGLGMKCLLSGTLATLMTGAVVGLLY